MGRSRDGGWSCAGEGERGFDAPADERGRTARTIATLLVAALSVVSLGVGCSGGEPGTSSETDAEDAESAEVGDAVPTDGRGDDDGGSDAAEDVPPSDPLADAGDAELLDTTRDIEDAGEGDTEVDAADAAPDLPPPDCPDPGGFDYACELGDPSTCPGGLCAVGLCLGPVLDPDRWIACGDETCSRCETASTCPTDCADPIEFTGEKEYDNETTMTVVVHGFEAVDAGEFESTVYGEAGSGGGLARLMRPFIEELPAGEHEPTAPNQLVGVEYYGAIPAEWLTDEDVEEIEVWTWRREHALKRYAMIVAKFIRHRLEISGATHVNLMCHSMGCHVSRYMMEHDLEGLASRNVFVRWHTVAGVIAGARLARLFDNPTVRNVAEVLQLNTSDFIHMNPENVIDNVARWDHQPYLANNPLLGHMIIHHQAGTDPRVSETADLVRLLDLNNPRNEPNDGIVYSFDEFFHDQEPALRFRARDGRELLPTVSWHFQDHFEVRESPATGALLAASLYHRRKVYVTLESVELRDDLERDGVFDFDNQGEPPAELAVETTVKFDPYVRDNFGQDLAVQETRIELARSPELWPQSEGETLPVGMRLFEGPVFDEMDSLWMQAKLLEVDQYPRFGVLEWPFDIHEELVGFAGEIPLEDGEHVWENGRARAVVRVEVVELY